MSNTEDPFEAQVTLTTLKQIIDSPEEFKMWLTVQPDSRSYERQDTCKCPIATFLNDKFKLGARVENYGVKVLYDVPGHYCTSVRVFQLPSWMRLFMGRWDLGEKHRPDNNITARFVLDEVIAAVEADNKHLTKG